MARKQGTTGGARRKLSRQRVIDPTRQTVLTPDGFRLIEERICDIRERRLPQLRPLLVDQDRDERDVAAFEALLAEADAFEALLAEAVVMSPDDRSDRVTLGAHVLLQLPDGAREWIRPVHPSEAFLDDERISIASPLGAAILGAEVGTSVTVHAPSGTWTAVIAEVCASKAQAGRELQPAH
ncbi:MAG: GreA/GreB family elongation factor [Actinomycetales bacterium]|nr:GreA/GreB family elongation factor [Actinomycetales bacterium]